MPRKEEERYHPEACSCQVCFDRRRRASAARPRGSMYCASCAHWRSPEAWKVRPALHLPTRATLASNSVGSPLVRSLGPDRVSSLGIKSTACGRPFLLRPLAPALARSRSPASGPLDCKQALRGCVCPVSLPAGELPAQPRRDRAVAFWHTRNGGPGLGDHPTKLGGRTHLPRKRCDFSSSSPVTDLVIYSL